MLNEVIVITGVNLGWDCVVGVFESKQAVLDSWLNQEDEVPKETWEEFEKVLDPDFIVHQVVLELED
jgi:hypothetical protein